MEVGLACSICMQAAAQRSHRRRAQRLDCRLQQLFLVTRQCMHHRTHLYTRSGSFSPPTRLVRRRKAELRGRRLRRQQTSGRRSSR